VEVVVTAPCPLCGGAGGRALGATPYDEIWRHLSSEWGARISDPVKRAHTPADVVELLLCRRCGLQYFSPAVAGSDQFYAELTSSNAGYYNATKWEFEHVEQLLRPHHRVLDVACGDGAFVASIRDRVRDAVGIDTNAEATRDGQGRAVLRQSVEEYARDHHEQFDLVSAFQVIEHVASVMPFVRASYACVKPGGVLVLSVPYRDRRRDPEFGSLDYPPHHLSRWSEAQLTFVARALGARVLEVAKEPLGVPQTVAALRRDQLPALVPYRFAGRELAFKVASRLALTFPMSRLWSRLDMSGRLGMFGMSMLIALEKPRSTCAA
jgi:SAM-dependent methyltransferase